MKQAFKYIVKILGNDEISWEVKKEVYQKAEAAFDKLPDPRFEELCGSTECDRGFCLIVSNGNVIMTQNGISIRNRDGIIDAKTDGTGLVANVLLRAAPPAVCKKILKYLEYRSIKQIK